MPHKYILYANVYIDIESFQKRLQVILKDFSTLKPYFAMIHIPKIYDNGGVFYG